MLILRQPPVYGFALRVVQRFHPARERQLVRNVPHDRAVRGLCERPELLPRLRVQVSRAVALVQRLRLPVRRALDQLAVSKLRAVDALKKDVLFSGQQRDGALRVVVQRHDELRAPLVHAEPAKQTQQAHRGADVCVRVPGVDDDLMLRRAARRHRVE